MLSSNVSYVPPVRQLVRDQPRTISGLHRSLCFTAQSQYTTSLFVRVRSSLSSLKLKQGFLMSAKETDSKDLDLNFDAASKEENDEVSRVGSVRESSISGSVSETLIESGRDVMASEGGDDVEGGVVVEDVHMECSVTVTEVVEERIEVVEGGIVEKNEVDSSLPEKELSVEDGPNADLNNEENAAVGDEKQQMEAEVVERVSSGVDGAQEAASNDVEENRNDVAQVEVDSGSVAEDTDGSGVAVECVTASGIDELDPTRVTESMGFVEGGVTESMCHVSEDKEDQRDDVEEVGSSALTTVISEEQTQDVIGGEVAAVEAGEVPKFSETFTVESVDVLGGNPESQNICREEDIMMQAVEQEEVSLVAETTSNQVEPEVHQNEDKAEAGRSVLVTETTEEQTKGVAEGEVVTLEVGQGSKVSETNALGGSPMSLQDPNVSSKEDSAMQDLEQENISNVAEQTFNQVDIKAHNDVGQPELDGVKVGSSMSTTETVTEQIFGLATVVGRGLEAGCDASEVNAVDSSDVLCGSPKDLQHQDISLEGDISLQEIEPEKVTFIDETTSDQVGSEVHQDEEQADIRDVRFASSVLSTEILGEQTQNVVTGEVAGANAVDLADASVERPESLQQHQDISLNEDGSMQDMRVEKVVPVAQTISNQVELEVDQSEEQIESKDVQVGSVESLQHHSIYLQEDTSTEDVEPENLVLVAETVSGQVKFEVDATGSHHSKGDLASVLQNSDKQIQTVVGGEYVIRDVDGASKNRDEVSKIDCVVPNQAEALGQTVERISGESLLHEENICQQDTEPEKASPLVRTTSNQVDQERMEPHLIQENPHENASVTVSTSLAEVTDGSQSMSSRASLHGENEPDFTTLEKGHLQFHIAQVPDSEVEEQNSKVEDVNVGCSSMVLDSLVKKNEAVVGDGVVLIDKEGVAEMKDGVSEFDPMDENISCKQVISMQEIKQDAVIQDEVTETRFLLDGDGGIDSHPIEENMNEEALNLLPEVANVSSPCSKDSTSALITETVWPLGNGHTGSEAQVAEFNVSGGEQMKARVEAPHFVSAPVINEHLVEQIQVDTEKEVAESKEFPVRQDEVLGNEALDVSLGSESLPIGDLSHEVFISVGDEEEVMVAQVAETVFSQVDGDEKMDADPMDENLTEIHCTADSQSVVEADGENSNSCRGTDGNTHGEEVIEQDRSPSNEFNVQVSKTKEARHNMELSGLVHLHENTVEHEGEFSSYDLVWGKVKSHPWWPGQIFPSSDASERALKYQKKDSLLVAYFGDQTFAWNEPSSLRPFRTHFLQMEKQSYSESFRTAVSFALDEVSRRVELGLTCFCMPKEAYTEAKSQIIENAGIGEEVKERVVLDRSLSAFSFEPEELITNVKALALFPSNGVERLELAIAKAELTSFYRSKGYFRLPEFHVYGGLVQTEVAGSISGEVEYPEEVVDENLSQMSSGRANVKGQFSSSRKRKSASDEDVHPSRKERSLLDLMDEKKAAHLANGGKSSSKSASSSGKKHILSPSRDVDTEPPAQRSFKVGECIRRIASQLTGAPPILKSGGERFQKTAAKVSSSSEKFDVAGSSPYTPEESNRRRIASPKAYSFADENLSQLCSAAQDPRKRYNFLSKIIDFFTAFRNSVSLEKSSSEKQKKSEKMSGGRRVCGIRKPSNIETNFDKTFDFEDMSDCYWTDRIIQSSPEEQPSRTDRKSAGEFEMAMQMYIPSGEAEHTFLDPPLDFERQNLHPAEEKVTRKYQRRKRKSQHVLPMDDDATLGSKRHNPGGDNYLEKNAGYFNENNYVDEFCPTALILNFTEAGSIPSEMKLNRTFSRFGPLKESQTEVLVETNCARVVFKKRTDAEVALSSAGKFSIFGATPVNYELSYLSSTTSKAYSTQVRKEATSVEGNTTESFDF